MATKKDHPITTKAGKRQFIKELSKNMERKFLDKIDLIPDHWDGIEIRTWIALTWGNENAFSPFSLLHDPSRKPRAKRFRNDMIMLPL